MSGRLFEPVALGAITLKHRVVMAPLTRFRSKNDHTHSNIAIEYYAQRAMVPGTLIISEATFIAPEAGGYENVPGVWSNSQVKQWKKIVDAVHAKGSYIYLQLWALGRAATGSVLAAQGGYSVVSASDIGLNPNGPTRGTDKPRPLTVTEIEKYVQKYASAALSFVKDAGGDGVEIHGANGYLIDQFTQKNSNTRTDHYGGSVENRTRFAREVVSAVSSAIGANRTGIRLSPFSEFQEMKMLHQDIIETFSFLVDALKKEQPDLAYIHATEARVGGGSDQKAEEGESLDFMHTIWAPKALIVAGSYVPETAAVITKKYAHVLVAFGRYFISNPDLPDRIRNKQAFTPYNRKTFYLKGPEATEGYTDYLPYSQNKL